MSVWATSSGVRETTLHFGPFSLSSVQLDSALLSREGGCSLSLAHVCSPILWFWCVLGLKFTFFLSSLADLESLSDSHFAHNGIDTTAVSLIQYN